MKCFVSFFRVFIFFVYLFLVYFVVFNRIFLLLLLFFYPRSFLAFWTIILYLYLYVICVAIQSNIHKHLLLFYSSSWYFFISYIFCLNLFVYFLYTYFCSLFIFVLCYYAMLFSNGKKEMFLKCGWRCFLSFTVRYLLLLIFFSFVSENIVHTDATYIYLMHSQFKCRVQPVVARFS